MKVQIENCLPQSTQSIENNIIVSEMNLILVACLAAQNKTELINLLTFTTLNTEFKHFHFGFGGSHFWCSRVSDNVRVLFIEFKD